MAEGQLAEKFAATVCGRHLASADNGFVGERERERGREREKKKERERKKEGEREIVSLKPRAGGWLNLMQNRT
jgi:hypothetical protein